MISHDIVIIERGWKVSIKFFEYWEHVGVGLDGSLKIQPKKLNGKHLKRLTTVDFSFDMNGDVYAEKGCQLAVAA